MLTLILQRLFQAVVMMMSMGWWSPGLLVTKGWHNIALRALTLAIFQLALIMRLAPAQMLEVLRTGYIKFVKARELPNTAVHFGHALNNMLVPVITITGLQFSALTAFTIITDPCHDCLFVPASVDFCGDQSGG